MMTTGIEMISGTVLPEYSLLSTLHVITTLLLLVLLIERELLRSSSQLRLQSALHSINALIAPLLIAFTLLSVRYFANILR